MVPYNLCSRELERGDIRIIRRNELYVKDEISTRFYRILGLIHHVALFGEKSLTSGDFP